MPLSKPRQIAERIRFPIRNPDSHISTHEYYRSLIAQGEGLQANIAQLLKEQEKARLVIAEAEQAKKTLPVSRQKLRPRN